MLIIKGVFFVLSLVFALRQVQIFQLNSYKNKVHLKWLAANFPKAWVWIVTRHSKKPLVFTHRVIRLLVTIVVILGAIGFFFQQYFLAFVLAYALVPFIVILANVINAPIEKLGRMRYIAQAKKMLKACPNLEVIGITGSYGKTSVKFYLSTLLRAKYNTLMTPESFNTPLGVTKTIREQLRATDEVFVCEMGAKQNGDIKEICDIVHPKIGVITSIGPQHLESFKSVENVIKTKYELIDSLPQNGMAFVNGDNEYITKNLPERTHITYGLNPQNDYCACEVRVSRLGTVFGIKTPKGKVYEFQTKLIGEHNVVNLVGAIAVCDYLGVSMESLQSQMRKIVAVPHRLELSENGDTIIIDDAYNSNPSGAKAALDTLGLFEEYKILITPGMVELGSRQEELNREFGVQAAKVCDMIILIGEKQTKPIFEGIVSEGFNQDKLLVMEDVRQAIGFAYGLKTNGRKVVLLENDLPDNY